MGQRVGDTERVLRQIYPQQVEKNAVLQESYLNLTTRHQAMQIALDKNTSILTDMEFAKDAYCAVEERFGKGMMLGGGDDDDHYQQSSQKNKVQTHPNTHTNPSHNDVNNFGPILVSVDDVSIPKLIQLLEEKMANHLNHANHELVHKSTKLDSDYTQRESLQQSQYNEKINRLETHYQQRIDEFKLENDHTRNELSNQRQALNRRESNLENEINKMRREYMMEARHQILETAVHNEALEDQNFHLRSTITHLHHLCLHLIAQNEYSRAIAIEETAGFYWECIDRLKKEHFITTDGVGGGSAAGSSSSPSFSGPIPTPSQYLASHQLISPSSSPSLSQNPHVKPIFELTVEQQRELGKMVEEVREQQQSQLVHFPSCSFHSSSTLMFVLLVVSVPD
jgi:hypothetical protein